MERQIQGLDENSLPHRIRVLAGHGFQPETLTLLGQAFEKGRGAIAVLDDSHISRERMRDLLARKIIELAQQGERDVGRLTDQAVLHVIKATRKQHSP